MTPTFKRSAEPTLAVVQVSVGSSATQTYRRHAEPSLDEHTLQHTSVDASTLSRLIDAMNKRKLVVPERDSADARARSLHLTPKGEEVVDRVIPLAQLYERVALAGMSREEAHALRGFLARIYDNMDMLNHRD